MHVIEYDILARTLGLKHFEHDALKFMGTRNVSNHLKWFQPDDNLIFVFNC